MLLNREQREQLKQLGSLTTIGLELGIYVAGLPYGGRLLDAKFDTAPWFQWIGLALGLAAAARRIYSVVRRAQKLMNDDDDSPTRDDSDKEKRD